MDLKALVNNSIIIAPNEFRDYFVLLKNNDLNLNFKFFTKEEVLSNLFGTPSESATLYLMKEKKLSFAMSRKYLTYLSHGATNLPILASLSKNRNLIYLDEYYKKLYTSSHILFVNYSVDDLEIKHILSELDSKNYDFISIDDLEFPKNDKTYVCLENIGQEVRYVLNLISGRIKNENKKPSDFVIVANLNNYRFYLDSYSETFNLPLNFDERDSLFETYSAKVILNNLSNIEEIFTDDKLFVSDINNFNLIRSLYKFYDLKNNKNSVVNFIQILKDFKIKTPRYNDGISVTSSFDFNPLKTYYLLGAIDDFLPRISDDNDLISDNEKKNNNLVTSEISNIYSFNITRTFLNYKNVVSITYPRENGKNDIAFILSNDNFSIKKTGPLLKQYSNKLAEFYYNNYRFQYKFFKNLNPEYLYLKNNFMDKKLYDNTYEKIDYKNDSKINYSYTSIEEFIECPFKYYCDKVLKLGTFVDTTGTKFGKFGHRIFEDVYNDDFIFENSKNEHTKEFNFDEREMALLPRFLSEVNIITDNILKQNSINKLKKTYHERKIDIDCDDYYVTGHIDRINDYGEGIAIIDYKTGVNFSFDKYFFDTYGLSMQLPTYLYLTSLDETLKDKKICALVYQPVTTGKFYNYIRPTKDDFNDKKMVGFANGNLNTYVLFDSTILKEDKSLFVSGVSMDCSSKIKINKYIMSDDEFLNLANKAKVNFQNNNLKIKNNEFSISPYYISNAQQACNYCVYKDICYHKQSDYRFFVKESKKEDDEDESN